MVQIKEPTRAEILFEYLPHQVNLQHGGKTSS